MTRSIVKPLDQLLARHDRGVVVVASAGSADSWTSARAGSPRAELSTPTRRARFESFLRRPEHVSDVGVDGNLGAEASSTRICLGVLET